MREVCSNEHNHTPCPSDYFPWHAWAERMSKTHKQQRCPECCLFKIWIPKEDDPYGDIKIWHRANLINDKGEASALCYVRPRAIQKSARWTTDDDGVSCLKCLKLIHAQASEAMAAKEGER